MTALNVIRGIVSLTYILIISPYLLGSLLCCKLKGELMDSYVLRYVVGFFSQLGIWGIMALPITLFMGGSFPFHILCYTYSVLLIFISAMKSIIAISDKALFAKFIDKFSSGVKRILCVSYVRKVELILVLCIIFFQIIRAVLGMNALYQDNTHYIPEATNVLANDSLSALVRGGPKRVVAPWFSYMSYIAYLSMQHPLFIYETIMPVFIVILFYMGLWLLGEYLFHNDKSGALFFIMEVAILIVVLNGTIFGTYSLNTVRPTNWGKAILGGTVLPLTIVLYHIVIEKKEVRRYTFLLMLFTMGGTWLSATAVLVLPCTAFLLLLAEMLIGKKDWKVFWYSTIMAIPSLIQFSIYMFFYMGERVG